MNDMAYNEEKLARLKHLWMPPEWQREAAAPADSKTPVREAA